MTRSIAALLALALLAPLAGCGRAGPPRLPGPKDQITYPRSYPRPDILRVAPGGASLAAPDAVTLAPLGTSPGAAPNTPEVPPALR